MLSKHDGFTCSPPEHWEINSSITRDPKSGRRNTFRTPVLSKRHHVLTGVFPAAYERIPTEELWF